MKRVTLEIGMEVETKLDGVGTILAIDGSFVIVDFDGTQKKRVAMLLQAKGSVKAPKVKAYMKEVKAEVVNFNSIVNNLKGSKESRNSYLFFGETVYDLVERAADACGHFAGKIIQDARNGKTISDKQASVVAYFAKSKGFIS
jgi:hypothetical protein